MPDLPNRQQHEDDLTAAIMLLFRRQESALRSGAALSVDPPEAVSAALYATVMESGGNLANQYGVPIEGLSSRAKQWAMSYADVLSRQITETTEDMRAAHDGPITTAVVAAWMVILASRAENIAITETTRAATLGEQVAGGWIEELTGEKLIGVWYTEDDEQVCDICGPLHGTDHFVYDDVNEDGPPAHPRCRCWLEWEGAVA